MIKNEEIKIFKYIAIQNKEYFFMKKYKFLAIIITVALIAGVSIFFACEKEEKSTNSEKNLQTEAEFVIEKINPYDFLGEFHNEAMEIVLGTTINQQQLDLNDFTLLFLEEKFEDLQAIPSQNWNQRVSDVLSFLIENENYLFPIDFENPVFQSLQLSNDQIILLYYLLDKIETSESLKNLHSAILDVEDEILHSSMSSDEQWLLLGTISIAKYSAIFCDKHEKELTSDNKGPLQNFLNAAKRVVKADAIGFVAGVAGGIVQEVGMVFGPEGAVVALASDGAAGAIVGSGSQVIVEVTK
jgi:hypothetical protein